MDYLKITLNTCSRSYRSGNNIATLLLVPTNNTCSRSYRSGNNIATLLYEYYAALIHSCMNEYYAALIHHFLIAIQCNKNIFNYVFTTQINKNRNNKSNIIDDEIIITIITNHNQYKSNNK